MKISVIIAIVVVAIAISVGAYYYGIVKNQSKTTVLSQYPYPGYVPTNSINSIFGGTWSIVGNSSGYLSINHSNDSVTISYVNGTKITNPVSDYPNIYSNSFYNFTLLESVTEYYQNSNKSNLLMIEVLESNVTGESYLNQDIQTISSLYNISISKIGNIDYVQSGNSIIAVYNNYLIILASTNNYGNKMLTLLNTTVQTFK